MTDTKDHTEAHSEFDKATCLSIREGQTIAWVVYDASTIDDFEKHKRVAREVPQGTIYEGSTTIGQRWSVLVEDFSDARFEKPSDSKDSE